MAVNKTKHMGIVGELYDYPRKLVEKISQIKVADHMMFQRPLYEHHGIVVAVDKEEGTFDVIEYDGNKTKALAKVHCKTHVFSEETENTIYIVEYNGECLPDEQVIENAYKWLNAKGYNFLLNNCECMSQACKTGKAKSEQVRNMLRFLGKTVVSNLGTGILKRISKVATGGAVKVALATYDIRKIVKQNKAGKLNKRRRDAMIGTRVATAGGSIGGAIGGMILGMLLGGPIGAPIGALIGGLGGAHMTLETSKSVVAAIERHTDHFEDKYD